MGIATRLYRGETTFPLIRRRKTFYAISAGLMLACLLLILLRQFNLGVEFKGGAVFQWPAKGATVEQARDLFEDLQLNDPIVQTVGRGDSTDLRVQTPPITEQQIDDSIRAITERFPEVTEGEINPSNVGPAWGRQVTSKALQGLALFLVAVVVYISIRFEPKMAVAAIVALAHDLLVVGGVYALLGFVVTPATVIATLTILGYSLYDTIVVFDKVEENTRGLAGGSRATYSEQAELAVNQTFMRSINTSLIALLPVAGLLFVGAYLLGAGTLKDLSLALFVGIAAGAYSSLFLATPVLADLKEREPQYKALTQRVLARRSGQTRGDRAGARARAEAVPAEGGGSVLLTKDDATTTTAGPAPSVAAPTATRRPAAGGSANKKKGRPGRPGQKRR